MPLNPRQEKFCRLYAAAPNGAAAARDAGYAPSHAANQSLRLLKQTAIMDRIAALRSGDLTRDDADPRDDAARALAAQLQPVYDAALKDRDYDGVLQTVELQARIRGFASGGSSIKPRGPRPDGDVGEETPDAEYAVERAEEIARGVIDDVQKLRRRQDRIEHVVSRMADAVDPGGAKSLLSWFHDDLLAWDAEEGYYMDDLTADGMPANDDANADESR